MLKSFYASLLLGAVLLLAGPARAQQQPAGAATFTNPLLPAGADPWSIFHDGFYYYTHTTGRNITLWKTRSLSQLRTAPSKVVWTPPATGPNSREIWAPELHRLNGKWYLYYAADAGRNPDHRLWVLENSAADPLEGTWVDKGQITDATNKWAIDGSVFENNGQLYFVWSGWEGDVNGRQDIYLARMQNPWTIDGPRLKVSTPVFAWERNGDLGPNGDPPHVDVNEGPQLLRHNSNLYLIYSASGCWTDNYALGMLTASASADLLQPGSWAKSPTPVFQQNAANKVYAPGHNSFFTSPDGTQNWILYHANDEPGQGCGRFRTPRAQPFTWNPDGTPNFGNPVPVGQPLARPSGEK
ncbi:glycoside hydrolase family 43 protein [Hymenobacter swuensis]|uniref:Glycoside hydrolase family protein n=1 Tax=Hymenobacter swuensis DY53 TaxID=1227739 RepID=W8F075_9BACT|nr:glycoside hydrolase family 43 protein [Hymenobacter swuensis]AHJ98303.1 glycoside hydrolase family protein [Hymenobacter swuensis DY53]